MLPFDKRPWAKALARTVIFASIVAAGVAVYLCYVNDELHISELAIVGLSLLTILPPNLAILLRKPRLGENSGTLGGVHLGTR